jgi:hypothetical protein
MSKTRRRPLNHGKHTDPATIRTGNGGPQPVSRRRRASGEGTRLGAPVADETPPVQPGPVQPGPVQPGSVQPGSVLPGPVLPGHPPWTSAGDYLRAAAVEEAPARLGTPPGPVDDFARRVWRTAFGLAVRRRFEPASPLAEISRTVATAVHLHEPAGLPPIEVEMLIRAELGEQVPVDELDPEVTLGTHLLVFASLVDELALGDRELDDLVTEAERLAAAG